MKSLFRAVFGSRANAKAPTASGREEESPLKRAFRSARESGNIDVVLPVLREAELFVVAGAEATSSCLSDLYLVPSPGNTGRMCVTVSEREEWLSKIDWPKIRTRGSELLSYLPPLMEIVVVYGDGGDFISREHRDWYAQLGKYESRA